MLIVFNIILILVVLLIAYWWANQGFFSALLHLACVVVAGAVALAFWEPVTSLVLLGSFFDDFAWGVVLIGLFAISLFLLRLGMDKLAPANVKLPHWANLAFGFAAGAVAGALTIGMLVIGLGHVQSTDELLGLRGWARSDRTAEVTSVNALWVPFHQITDEFYSWLSVTSLSTRSPLRHYAPDLYKQATLVRDSAEQGKGKLSLKPSEAQINGLYSLEGGGGQRLLLDVHFANGARDWGDQLTVSSAQVRMLGAASGTARPDVLHPVSWLQQGTVYNFDHVSHYVTSVAGQQTADVVLVFRAPRNFTPRFVQIRGTRYRLPRLTPTPAQIESAFLGHDRRATAGDDEPIEGGLIDSVIEINTRVRGLTASTNALPAGIRHTDNALSSGKALFRSGGPRVGRDLAITGIYEPEGTRCVRVDVSRGSVADIFRIMDRVADDATLAMIDSTGKEYSPVGYIHRSPDGISVHLEPTRLMRTTELLPMLPSSGDQQLELVFYITENVTITGFRFGDIALGSCSVLIPAD